MGGISDPLFIALLKLLTSGPYFTLFIRFYYMSDEGWPGSMACSYRYF